MPRSCGLGRRGAPDAVRPAWERLTSTETRPRAVVLSSQPQGTFRVRGLTHDAVPRHLICSSVVWATRRLARPLMGHLVFHRRGEELAPLPLVSAGAHDPHTTVGWLPTSPLCGVARFFQARVVFRQVSRRLVIHGCHLAGAARPSPDHGHRHDEVLRRPSRGVQGRVACRLIHGALSRRRPGRPPDQAPREVAATVPVESAP